jgi:hypothetical protein
VSRAGACRSRVTDAIARPAWSTWMLQRASMPVGHTDVVRRALAFTRKEHSAATSV